MALASDCVTEHGRWWLVFVKVKCDAANRRGHGRPSSEVNWHVRCHTTQAGNSFGSRSDQTSGQSSVCWGPAVWCMNPSSNPLRRKERAGTAPHGGYMLHDADPAACNGLSTRGRGMCKIRWIRAAAATVLFKTGS